MYIHTYIYIERERDRERYLFCVKSFGMRTMSKFLKVPCAPK